MFELYHWEIRFPRIFELYKRMRGGHLRCGWFNWLHSLRCRDLLKLCCIDQLRNLPSGLILNGPITKLHGLRRGILPVFKRYWFLH